MLLLFRKIKKKQLLTGSLCLLSQVDCVLPVVREEPVPLTTPLKFQSIGVQVENGRP